MTDEQKKMIIDNMPLVNYVIKNKIHLNEDEFDDLYQEGCYYLYLSVLNFNPDLGFKFSTYATSMIWGGLRRYKRDNAMNKHGIRMPRSLIDKNNSVQYAAYSNGYDLDNPSDLEYIMQCLGIDMYRPIQTTSMNSIVRTSFNATTCLGDLIPDKIYPYGEVEFYNLIDSLLGVFKKKLNDTGFSIISMVLYKYLESGVVLTQMEIAELFDISQSYVSRILSKCKKITLEYIE